MTAQSSNYNFDADVNRDGIINSQDLKIAKEDLGVSTKVSPVVSVNLDPASNPAANRTTPLQHGSLRRRCHPQRDRHFLDQSSGTTTTATADSTGAYSIMVPLVTGSNTFTVTTQDAIRTVDRRRDHAGGLLASRRRLRSSSNQARARSSSRKLR